MIRKSIEAYGRIIELEVSDTLDAYSQFPVEVFVDNKSRYKAHFTDKSWKGKEEQKIKEVIDHLNKREFMTGQELYELLLVEAQKVSNIPSRQWDDLRGVEKLVLGNAAKHLQLAKESK